MLGLNQLAVAGSKPTLKIRFLRAIKIIQNSSGHASKMVHFTRMKQSAILTESDFRAAISKQAGFPEPYNTYACPSCEADVRVGLPHAKYAFCDECKTRLEIHPDAEFDEDGWHDRTTLSIVETEEEA